MEGGLFRALRVVFSLSVLCTAGVTSPCSAPESSSTLDHDIHSPYPNMTNIRLARHFKKCHFTSSLPPLSFKENLSPDWCPFAMGNFPRPAQRCRWEAPVSMTSRVEMLLTVWKPHIKRRLPSVCIRRNGHPESQPTRGSNWRESEMEQVWKRGRGAPCRWPSKGQLTFLIWLCFTPSNDVEKMFF